MNAPLPALPSLADIYTPTPRPAGDINTSIRGEPELLQRYLELWRERDAELERGEPAPPGAAERAQGGAKGEALNRAARGLLGEPQVSRAW